MSEDFTPPVYPLATTPPAFISVAIADFGRKPTAERYQELFDVAMKDYGGFDHYINCASREAQRLINDGRPIQEMIVSGVGRPYWLSRPGE